MKGDGMGCRREVHVVFFFFFFSVGFVFEGGGACFF